MTTTWEFILVNAGRDELVAKAAASVIAAIGTVLALAGMRTPSPSPAVPGAAGEHVGDGGVDGGFPRFLGDDDGGVDGFWFCCGGVEGF